MSFNEPKSRLKDLLIEPREELNVEIKNWLDIQHSKEDKATLAKAIIALANHGGGFILVGLEEREISASEAAGRPPALDRYNQDIINGIVSSYCDPEFHCSVHFERHQNQSIFPIISVPGGHQVPVRAKRSGPNEKTIQKNAIYMRKIGPKSETPQSSREWDELLHKCLLNRREDLFEQIRSIVTGSVRQVDPVANDEALSKWSKRCFARWKSLAHHLPDNSAPRMPHGYYYFSYELKGDRKELPLSQLPKALQQSETRHTGWPPFWYPTKAGITPYPIDNTIECWLGNDAESSFQFDDAAHSDFWRVNPEGFAFLMRGYQEDGDDLWGASPAPEAGTMLDVTLPIWRIGETLLHAKRLASHLFDGPTTLHFSAFYSGLEGRSLGVLSKDRVFHEKRTAHQNSVFLSTHVETQTIEANLPEIVHPLLSPLYELFDFYEPSIELVATELNRMRSGKF
ncbi:RNA-binding domain-containing protein [Pseudovibrio sp. Ad26]|uniref:AlbA family DNA-binding domain-containing protein n=1 Tax=Pseudovibrio sp. Ad26 TaxID=989410 RepID=UPI0007AEAB48|nr:RNA-binding domain-containing protein [Pseudovibrio sp. Ad26]KZL15878.1 Divergent AAA domain protein [Pseudovibrio sp. Ad26]